MAKTSGPAQKKAQLDKPLAEAAWNFEAVSDDELDACFYYEFARSSKLIRDGVEGWRTNFSRRIEWRRTTLQTVKTNWFRAPQSPWKPGNLSMSHVDDIDDGYSAAWGANEDAESLKPETLSKAHPLVLDFVAAFEEFPSTPWLQITDLDKRAEFAATWRVPDLQHCAGAVGCSDHILEACDLQGLSAWREVRRTERAPANASIKPGLHLFAISWNYEDDEIAAAVKAWCFKNRPPEYRTEEPKPKKKMLGLNWRVLPFGKRAGLDYLGVWRRREACGKQPWKKFFSIGRWAPAAFVEKVRSLRAAREKLLLKGADEFDKALQKDAFADSDNIIRDLQDKCAKAESFIAQLEGREG